VRPHPPSEGSGSLIKSIVNNSIFPSLRYWGTFGGRKVLIRQKWSRGVLSPAGNVAMFDLKICVTLSNCSVVTRRTLQ